ncbi:MAG: sigma 54-interacting transcriptional regulator [Desulfobacterales bacterium]|nr:sigma 54-interacting transcriptional regulator [Desulfobacterales bacterium]
MRAGATAACCFLDEIGDMTLPLQSKLLHVLQGGDFTPLGSEKAVKTDAWVIAATNHDLEKELAAGRFREDLYFRLSAIKIFIEPLRNRPEDIPYLIDYYIQKYNARVQRQEPGRSRRQKTIDRLCAYSWPGNVRELQNMLKRIMILGDGEENISGAAEHGRTDSTRPAETAARMNWRSRPPKALRRRASSATSPRCRSKRCARRPWTRWSGRSFPTCLQKPAWNRSKATKILKISYKTLLYKIKDLGIQPPPDAFE